MIANQLKISPEIDRSAKLWLRIAIAGWIVLAVGAGVKSIIEPELHTVYTAFSHAARDWWSGHSLYQDRAYYYSPTFAVLMTPFAVFPDWLGGVLWAFASVAALVWGLRLFFRDVLSEEQSSSNELSAGQPSRFGFLPATSEGPFLLLALIGTVRSVWSGQSNALLMALVLLGAVAIGRRKWWIAAALLAAPIYIKVWPVVIAGLFAVQWPRRLMIPLATAVVAFAMLPMLTKPPSDVIASYQDWHACLQDRQASDFRFPGYRDAWTLWEQFGSPNKRAYSVLQLMSAGAVLGWCLWQRRRVADDRLLAVYTIAAWSAWQLLFGPGTERLTYNIIAPPLAWAVLAAWQSHRGRWWAIGAYLTTYLLGVGGVERLLTQFLPAAKALEPVGVLIFAAWLVWQAAATKRGTIAKSASPGVSAKAA